MNVNDLVAAVMLAALVLYALTGGADFGGGVWDLLATGPRAAAQRTLVEEAIAPIWEANHVWLIVVVVILFTAFPAAYAAASTTLHLPLTLMLLGIVARGSAFVFRSYSGDSQAQRRWGRLFAIASTVTPLTLGIVLGALTGAAWLGAFPFAVGLFALAQFAFLAAVYLANEAKDAALQGDFRRRALGAGIAVGACALGVVLLAGAAGTHFRRALLHSWWSWPLQLAALACAVGALVTLYARRFRLARGLACAQVTLVVVGWGLAQHPYLLAPDVTIDSAAAPERTLRLVLLVLGVGSVALLPALAWLYRVFKRR